MKQIWPNYSYSPATNVLTLTGLNIDRDQLLLVGAPERGRIMYNFADSAVTASAYTAGANTALTLVASTAGLTTTASLVIYYDDQLQSTAITISNFPATQPVSIASVTIGNTVTIAGTVTANPTGTQTIAGTVTANVPNIQVCTQGNFAQTSAIQTALGVINENNISQVLAVFGSEAVEGEGTSAFVQVRNQISGTVTIGSALPAGTNRIGVVTIGAGTVTIGAGTAQIGSVTASISGTVPISIASVTVGNSVTIASFATSVTARLINPAGTSVTYAEVGTAGSPSIDVLSVQGVSGGTSLLIGGTTGSFTTRFGSVTTANTAQISTAVTNLSRKYLFVQNVTTSSNVITVGIGFTPTTTQGIQLATGALIDFESSFIPTGAVYILSSVTGSPFTILEA